jgi:Family of unknown function (DUF5681)
MTNDLDKTVPESGRGNYEVGYKKPPRNRQFRKGKSGNPAGRPKRAVNVQASLTKTLSEPVLVRIDGKPRKMSSLDAGLLNLRTNMLKGDPKAFAILVKMMAAADMIKLPQESETDVSINREDQRMLDDLCARYGLDASSKSNEVDHE